MHIVKFFGAIKKKLSPRNNSPPSSTPITMEEQFGGMSGRKCRSGSNTPRRRNSSSSSYCSSGGEDEQNGMMIIEEGSSHPYYSNQQDQQGEEHFFVWDNEKIKSNIAKKQQHNTNNNNNNNNRVSLDSSNHTNNRKSSVDDSNHTNHHTIDQQNGVSTKRSPRKLFSKYNRSSSVSSCLDQLASSSPQEKEKKKASTSPRFDFFSKKRKSSSDLECKRSHVISQQHSSSQPAEEIDYSEFNLRIPSSRTLNLLLCEPKTVSPTSQLPPLPLPLNNISKQKISSREEDQSKLNEMGEGKMLEPNHSLHQSSSSFDAFFEDYSNAVLDQTLNITNTYSSITSNNNNIIHTNNSNSNGNIHTNDSSSTSLSSLANDELCSMKSFRRTPSSAKSNNNIQQKKESCELRSNKLNGASSTFSSSSSSTSIDLMGEDTLMKYGIVRISFEPLTSNTTTPQQPQQTTEELLEKLQE